MEKSLIEKIRKLIALQEGAQKIGSIEEAANAAEKIRALLIKHNLDIYSIKKGAQEEEETHKFMVDTGELSTKVEGDWVRALADVIAEFNLCTVIGTGKARSYIYIIGKPSNTETCWYIIQQLVNRIRPMARESFKNYMGYEKRNTYIRGFLSGCVKGIRKQLAEKAAREAYNAKMDVQNGLIGTTALMTMNMVSKHKADNDRFVQANFRVTMRKAPKLSSSSGKQQGTEAGYGMSIHKGLGSKESGPKGFLN